MAEESFDQNTFVPKVTIDVAAERRRPRLEALLFAEYATKSEGGLYHLSGCFNRLLFSKGEKRITNRFYLYVQTGETRDGEFQVAVFSPGNELLLAMSFEIETAEYSPKYPTQFHLLHRVQFPVPVEGNYWFDVSYRGESLGGAPLIIDFKDEELVEDERQG